MAVNNEEPFVIQVEAVINQQDNESLQRNWEDAIAFGSGAEADAFWIRNSDDLVNIV